MDKVTLIHPTTGKVLKTGRRSMDKYLDAGFVLQGEEETPDPESWSARAGLFSTDEDQDYDDDDDEEV